MLLSWGEVLVSDESRLFLVFRGPLVNHGDFQGLDNLSGATEPLQPRVKEEHPPAALARGAFCPLNCLGYTGTSYFHLKEKIKLKVIKIRIKMLNSYIR